MNTHVIAALCCLSMIWTSATAVPECQYIGCPPFTQPRTPGACINSTNVLTECDCISGYVKNKENSCVLETSTFRCPPRSTLNPKKQNAKSADDCICEEGYLMRDGTCVTACGPKVACPLNSFRIPSSSFNCEDTISSCECVSGFEMFEGKCLKRCPPGTIICPPDSLRATTCPIDLNECKCLAGFVLEPTGCRRSRPADFEHEEIRFRYDPSMYF